MKLNLIVATASNMGIGLKGTLPWRLKKDMALFARLTKWTQDPQKKNAVIMGRTTWESIPEKNRPLGNRLNIVLSTTLQTTLNEEVLVCQSFDAAIELLKSSTYCNQIENVWIIGGASVYKEAMDHCCCHRIYVTRILKEFECDVFMPSIDTTRFNVISDPLVPEDVQEENDIKFKYEVYEKILS